MSAKKRRKSAQITSTVSTVAGMLGNAETRKAILASLKPGGSASASADAADAEIPAPAWLAEYGRHSAAVATSSSSPADLMASVRDFDRAPQWFVLHAAWRGEQPGLVSVGDAFAQQILIMDIPVEVRWKVADVSQSTVYLHGTGPMGITLGLSVTVAGHQAGSVVRVDVGAEGPPLRGPVGTTAMRSIDAALGASVERLAAMASGPARPVWTVLNEPVVHEETGRLLEPTTPVVVGVGQLVQREPQLDRDPAAMAAIALRAAADDAGVGEALLAAADAVYAVPSASWTYRDQAAQVADLVGATPDERVQSTPYGGDGAQLLINEAASAIAQGRSRIVLVSGAEAGATLAAIQKDGSAPSWPEQDDDAAPDRVVGVDRVANHEFETAVGLGAPVYMYGLIESAVRRRRGHSQDEHQRQISQLWSQMSAIAANNPYAWSPAEVPADVLAVASDDNRNISAPYTKLMCANLQVDLASGVIVMSAAAAHAAGIPQDKWVFIHAGASAHDQWFVAERDDFSVSPAIRDAGRAALSHAGLSIDDVKHVDLYSCFPSAVQIAADAFGLPVGQADRPLSVTGGLTFAGGPGNNYGGHAVATMVGLLRQDRGAFGLSTSLGWYATKHAVGIYSTTPPASLFVHHKPMVERPASRRLLRSYSGEAVIEATTVPYHRDGTPEAAVLSLLTPDGERVLVRTESADVLQVVLSGEPLGRRVAVGADVELLDDVASLPSVGDAPVRCERRGPVAVITLDRPHVRNAIDGRTAQALEQAIDDAEADHQVRVIVLTGAGGTFCAGMDLKAAARGDVPVTERRGPLGLTGQPPTKPLISAVEGSALAGGCELALASDLIVASADAQFGIPEAKRGLLAAAGGIMRLRDRLPRNIAMELTLTGDPMPASRMAELGLVNRITDPGGALVEALRLADAIAVNAPLSVSVGKQMIDAAPSWAPQDAFEQQSLMASSVIMSDDAKEGVAAFAEGREPVWRGR